MKDQDVDGQVRVHDCLYGFCDERREECERCDAAVAALRRRKPKQKENAMSNEQAEIARLRQALEPFAFTNAPEKFLSPDGGCTEALIADEHVQRAREVLGSKP